MSGCKQLRWAMAAIGFGGVSAWSQPFINELLFAPPGPDIPNQYIELRGVPNASLPVGSYLIVVDGNGSGDPGRIENVFDLSGRKFGGNGFLLLLQKASPYSPSPSAAALVNEGSGSGFGSGSSSSIGHRGRSGRTDLPHASVSFLLIQATNAPTPGTDIDGNDDGVLGGATAGWTILDSVGVAVDGSDVGYGLINFTGSGGATASGTVVPVSFNPTYLGRAGNTTNAAAGSWVAGGSLAGVAPGWSLSNTRTVPGEYSGLALNHIGLPNFGAAALPGLVAIQPGGGTEVSEGGGGGFYWLGLNTTPAGTVVVQIVAGPRMQVSIDGGSNYFASCALSLSNTNLRNISVRALFDGIIQASSRTELVRHTVLRTDDVVQYPLTTFGPEVAVNVLEQESLLLSELKVNPPGTNDAPCEYVEIRGPPGALLQDIILLAVEGNQSRNPGVVKLAINLSGAMLGSSGLLVLASSSNPYTIPANTTLLTDAGFDRPGGGLENRAVSFLLVASQEPILEGSDLDVGNNGVLGGMPAGARILDAVGWTGVGAGDVVYGGVTLSSIGTLPDAVGRFWTNLTPRAADAWYFGELASPDCGALVFDATRVSSNFPFGITLSPGTSNALAVQLTAPSALSGVIGDPTNPGLTFSVSAPGMNADLIAVTASSGNQAVVPDANLRVVSGPNGQRTLYLNPVGVGYAMITLTAVGAAGLGQTAFPYAASDMGRPGGVWHTGSSDASAAIATDANFVLVGDNENNVIRLYERHRSGAPIQEFDFQQALGLTPDEHGEVNIEASTRSGNRLFFIGAHSNSNLGVTRTNRNRLFAADLSGSGTNLSLTYVGRYDYLKPDLISWDSDNRHGKGSNYYGFAASAADTVNPKAPDGFNIEGLTMAPGSASAAWVGFRAPIVPATNRTCALIVPVLNFTALAATGGPQGSAVFGAPIEIDLYGRGIRSVEGNATGFLISGGPAGDVLGYPDDFRLYTWTGSPADQPQQRAANLSGLQPEAIPEVPPGPWTPQTLLQLISDNGTTLLYGDGIQNKHLLEPAFKKFRSDWVTLGAIVKPMPIITRFTANATAIGITWRALQGETYRIQYALTLETNSWADVSADIVAGEKWVTRSLARPSGGQGFYRVRLTSTP
jgi:hypothetical protein